MTVGLELRILGQLSQAVVKAKSDRFMIIFSLHLLNVRAPPELEIFSSYFFSSY